MTKFVTLVLIFNIGLAFAQTSNLTLKDLLAIDSQEAFERVLIENNFERKSTDEMEKEIPEELIQHVLLLSYGFGNLKNFDNEELALIWADGMFIKDKELSSEKVVTLLFRVFEADNFDSFYNRIFAEVKQKCTFDKVKNADDGISTSYYNCPNPQTKGKIGFFIKGGIGVIEMPRF